MRPGKLLIKHFPPSWQLMLYNVNVALQLTDMTKQYHTAAPAQWTVRL